MPAILQSGSDYDLQDELHRKVAETCDQLQARLDRGEISQATYCEGLRVLRDAVSGLVDSVLTIYIDERLRTLPLRCEHSVSVLVRGENVVVVRRELGDDQLTVWKFSAIDQDGVRRDFSNETGDTVRLAQEKERALVTRMRDSGYRRLWDMPTREAV